MAARPARLPTRESLLSAGRAIVVAEGFIALTVRRAAAEAGANLGSFVYHFKTRDAYVSELIEAWYAPLFSRVTVAVDGQARPLDRLRRAILQLIDFGVEQDVFLARLLMAATAGELAARRFLGSIAGRHPRLLIKLIRAAQADGTLVREDPLQILMFLLGSVGLPRLVSTAWQGPPLFGKTLSTRLSRVARDRDRIVQRLNWALHGLSPGAK